MTTVWVTTDTNGNVNGLYRNAAPVPAPANLTTMDDGSVAVQAFLNPLTTLAGVQKAQSASLNASCAAQITGGFTSSALGSAYTYPSKTTDQANLTASVLASLMPGLPSTWATPFWCCNSSGAWALVQHTAAQIQQAGQAGKTAITAAIQKNDLLQAQVAAATTIAAVEAVTW